MKRTIALLCFLALTFSIAVSLCAYAASEETAIGEVLIIKTANVRSKASYNASLVGSAAQGQKYELLAEVPDWYKIRLNNRTTGWIHVSLATVTERYFLLPDPFISAPADTVAEFDYKSIKTLPAFMKMVDGKFEFNPRMAPVAADISDKESLKNLANSLFSILMDKLFQADRATGGVFFPVKGLPKAKYEVYGLLGNSAVYAIIPAKANDGAYTNLSVEVVGEDFSLSIVYSYAYSDEEGVKDEKVRYCWCDIDDAAERIAEYDLDEDHCRIWY